MSIEDHGAVGHLARLEAWDVLAAAIAEGVRSTDYSGYAGNVSDAGKYEGLLFGDPAPPGSIHPDGRSVLVRPEAAKAQRAAEVAETPAGGRVTGGGSTSAGTETGSGQGSGSSTETRRVEPPRPIVRRYHASRNLTPLRAATEARDLATEIIQHLAALHGARVTAAIEIEADVPEGIPDDVIRILSENGNTLRMTQGFEEE